MQNPYPDEPKIQKDRQMRNVLWVGLPSKGECRCVVDQGTTNLVCRRHEFGMGHLRDPAACYLVLDSTLSEYRRLRPRQKRPPDHEGHQDDAGSARGFRELA